MASFSEYPLSALSALDTEALVQQFRSDAASGLGEEEAEKRLRQYGPNSIAPKKRKSELIELLMHFRSPLVLILLAAAAISFSLNETVNAAIIFLIVLASVMTDYFQERDARNAAETLKQSVKTKTRVTRDGKEGDILPEELCPGDLVFLNAGRMVPADARVIAARDFFVNQSSLTGESFPCEKHSDAMPGATSDLAGMTNMVFMGSSVITGTAKAIIVKTGCATEFGKIAEKLALRQQETDFSRGMRQFGFLIMRITVILVLFIFLVNTVMKHNLLESFMFSIAVAVGLTPELLPMVMSVTMARGSLRMAKKGVVVKQLSAIPNFGSMEVLCTDKTGTLTEDRIELVKYTDLSGASSDPLFLLAYLNSYFQTGIRNPLDDAVLAHRKMEVDRYRKIDEVPFDFSRKRMSVVVEEGGRRQFICKGAPEEIIRVCTLDPAAAADAHRQYEQLSGEGFRVLAIAVKDAGTQLQFSRQDEQQLTLMGFISFLDPPKEDAGATIAALSAIGVEVKIITGDNHLVTRKICGQIGLQIKGVMEGHELDLLSDEALHRRVQNTTIFTRFSPGQKNRVIQALKTYHHAVGYMGDGINDAPSLKNADIGISVNSAADVAKDAAHIILTRKDLLVLKEGILEGRKTFGNTMKYILMGLSSNFGNMFSVAAATVFLPFLPMLPVQILINNFLYDTSQVTIPTDNVDESYTQRPQRWDMQMILRFMYIFGFASSLFDIATFYLLYSLFPVSEAQFRTGWFLESLSSQILVVFIIRTNRTPFVQSLPGKYLVFSTLACLLVGWLLPYTGVAGTIGFSPLPLHITIILVALVFIYLVVAELVKQYIYKRLAIRPAA